MRQRTGQLAPIAKYDWATEQVAERREGLKSIILQYYSGAALYCLTPTNEGVARSLAKLYRPVPVTRYELPAPDGFGEEDA